MRPRDLPIEELLEWRRRKRWRVRKALKRRPMLRAFNRDPELGGIRDDYNVLYEHLDHILWRFGASEQKHFLTDLDELEWPHYHNLFIHKHRYPFSNDFYLWPKRRLSGTIK
jgi:hypothetical protein